MSAKYLPVTNCWDADPTQKCSFTKHSSGCGKNKLILGNASYTQFQKTSAETVTKQQKAQKVIF